MDSKGTETPGGPPLPMVQIDFAEIPQEHRFDAWRETCAPVFDMAPREEEFSAGCTAYLLDHMVVNLIRFEKQVFMRRREMLGDSDYITLQLYLSGSIRGEVGNHPLVIEPDRIAIHDFGHPYCGTAAASQTLGMTIPRHLLAMSDWVYTHAPMYSWPLSSPQGSFLRMALFALWEQLPNATVADAPGLAFSFLGMLDGLISSTRKQQEFQASDEMTVDVIKRYVLANLEQPSLNVSQICKIFHCSRAKLYRLFQPTGGIQNFVRHQRLLRSFRALALSDPTMVRVREVAEHWGFCDASHFNRVFKATFGCVPSDVIGLHRRTSDGIDGKSTNLTYPPDCERLRGWLVSQ